MPELLQNPAFGILLFNLLIVWPLWRILRRAGLNPLWAFAALVPLVGDIVVFGVLTLSRWPNLPARKPALRRKARRTV